MNQDQLREALESDGCERLKDFYNVGPVQRAAVESFVAALIATQQAAPEYMHPIAILTKEVKPEHWEPPHAAPSQGVGENPAILRAHLDAMSAMSDFVMTPSVAAETTLRKAEGKFRSALLEASAQREQPAQAMQRWQIMPTVKVRSTNQELAVTGVYEDVVFVDLPEQPADDDKAEEEILQLIGERDRCEEIINQLCDAVLGTDRSEWSSAYHFEDAVREVDERMDADDKAGGEVVAYRLVGDVDERPFNTREHAVSAQEFYRSGGIETEIESLTRPQPQAEALRVPDGYALVPVEPTDEMRDAGNEVVLDRGKLFRAWKAMLSAAPQPEAQDIPAIFKEQAS